MVEKVIARVKDIGLKRADINFNRPGGTFTMGELYVFVIDMNSKVLADGGALNLVGNRLPDMRTADAKPLMKEFIDLVSARGEGWIDYKWINPATKKTLDKLAYLKNIPGTSAFAGCRIYRK